MVVLVVMAKDIFIFFIIVKNSTHRFPNEPLSMNEMNLKIRGRMNQDARWMAPYIFHRRRSLAGNRAVLCCARLPACLSLSLHTTSLYATRQIRMKCLP